MAVRHPADEFFFLFGGAPNSSLQFPPNVTKLEAGIFAGYRLFRKYWYDYKLPSTLKKIRADIFVATDGICSMRTQLPQCLIVQDLAFLHGPGLMPTSVAGFLKKHTASSVNKAKQVVTASQYSREELVRKYGVPQQKLNLVNFAASPIFHPGDWEEKQNIKENYSGGKEYFLSIGPVHPRKNLRNLLKAFSIFKKWQKSNMQLLITGGVAWDQEAFVQSIETYKYREDLKLLGYVPAMEYARIIASANALIYPSYYGILGLPMLEAMQSGVPVVSSRRAGFAETAGGAALFVDPENVQDIADKMMTVYKDEQLRNDLIVKGLERARDFDWDQAADRMWDIIQQTAKP